MARARLAERILRHLTQAGDHLSAVPGLSFYRRDGFCEPVSALYEPSLSLVVQGRKRDPIQPRIPAIVRQSADPRHLASAG